VSSFTYSKEVSDALTDNRPIVALESTIISHGLPRPNNQIVAEEFESIIREEGAVPATIAIIKGSICVGLTKDQLEFVATSGDVSKASTRDIGFVLAKNKSAATTVAATSHISQRAGIQVFATGGLGGIHRGYNDNFDESADLEILSHTPIIVVCAGVKSILDIGATLERLETLGIAVCGYQTSEFPGFYRRASGFTVDWQLDTPEEIASAFLEAGHQSLAHALIVANPVSSQDELALEIHEAALKSGLEKAEALGIRGKAVTPFLLDHFHTTTNQESLRVNVQVVKQNARLAARISKALKTQ
jgi:pseudouridine-5'-phosphate glycosidase